MRVSERWRVGTSLAVGSLFSLGFFFWLGTLSRAAPVRVEPTAAFIVTMNEESVARELQVVNRDRPVLLLVFSVECPYCEINMPQWDRLLRAVNDSPDVDVLLLSKSPFTQTLEYIDRHAMAGTHTNWVDGNQLATLDASATPSTVFVPAGSDEILIWRGVLSDARLQRVIRTIERATRSMGRP